VAPALPTDPPAGPGGSRFLTLADVAEVLNISASQTYALVRSGELVAIKIGGRGQWRVERSELEAYIGRMYDQTREFVASHPFAEDEGADRG
jgi:excisionase family DNA binding protein